MTKPQDYAEKTKAQVDQIASEIEKLQVRTDKVMEELRTEYDRRLQEVSAEYDKKLQEIKEGEHDMGKKIEIIRIAGGGALEEMKAGADLAVADMKNAVARAKEKFKDI
jgi:methyl-accepting chemotaxis protein